MSMEQLRMRDFESRRSEKAIVAAVVGAIIGALATVIVSLMK